MAKEVRHQHSFALPKALAEFLPHSFVTPQHLLQKPNKSDRLIFDSVKKFDWWSTPVGEMTSTKTNGELKCEYGTVLRDILTRAWNLRITYPHTDLAIYANNAAGAFRQLKVHPDCMPAFSCIVADFIFLQCGQAFGTGFAPANWEAPRQIAEILATTLFDNKSLCDKHRQ